MTINAFAYAEPAAIAETAQTTMRVRKRNGNLEPVDVNKIVRAVGRCCASLQHVDSIRVATKTIGGLYDGATTKELDRLSINTAASLIVEEPEYSRLAARLLATYIDKEVRNQEIQSFSQSISAGHQTGLISAQVAEFVAANSRKLNDAVEPGRNDLFEYFFLRVACGLAQSAGEAITLYELFSSLEYMPSTPTLFNSATNHQQLSSCFLLDSPRDELEAIYRKYTDVALLSKFAGGIGIAYHRVRSNGSHIRGTNGHSNGVIPWLKTLDSSVAAVNQCFAPETFIYTADGPREIQNVRIGDLTLGQRGEYRVVEDHFVYSQDGPMVAIDVKHSIA